MTLNASERTLWIMMYAISLNLGHSAGEAALRADGAVDGIRAIKEQESFGKYIVDVFAE